MTLDNNTITGSNCLAAQAAPKSTSQTTTQTAVQATPKSTSQSTTQTAAAPKATLSAVVPGLPGTGGGPIRNEDFPWSLVIFGGFTVAALALGFRAIRRTNLPK